MCLIEAQFEAQIEAQNCGGAVRPLRGLKMKISLPKRIFLTKNEIFNTKRDGFYQNLYNILSKIIIQGLHLIFDFLEFFGDPCPRDITRILYQNEMYQKFQYQKE